MLSGCECVWWAKSYYSVGQNWQVADFLLHTSQLWAPAQLEGQLVASTQGWPVWSSILCLAREVCPSDYFQRQLGIVASHTSGSKDPLACELHTHAPVQPLPVIPHRGRDSLVFILQWGRKLRFVSDVDLAP